VGGSWDQPRVARLSRAFADQCGDALHVSPPGFFFVFFVFVVFLGISSLALLSMCTVCEHVQYAHGLCFCGVGGLG
jgi:hypothetical protein